MKCRVCGGMLRATTTDLPFKVSERTIVIVKSLPVSQCERCAEYLLADDVFAKVEALLSRADREIVSVDGFSAGNLTYCALDQST